jgi:hypothetical protein
MYDAFLLLPNLILLLFPGLASILPSHFLHLLLGEKHGDVDGFGALQGLQLDRMLDEVGDGALADFPALVAVSPEDQLIPPFNVGLLVAGLAIKNPPKKTQKPPKKP